VEKERENERREREREKKKMRVLSCEGEGYAQVAQNNRLGMLTVKTFIFDPQISLKFKFWPRLLKFSHLSL